MSLMNEVGFLLNYCFRNEGTESAWNRCKNMVPRQQKSWASSLRGWRWDQMDFRSFLKTVA